MESTKPTSNEAENGNKSKTLLAVALWFRIKRIREPRRNVCAIYNKFFRVIKNSKGIYFYEFADFSSMKYKVFYKGKKTIFLNKYVIYVITILFNLIGIPLVFLCYYPFAYFEGARNFIKDTVWYNNVRFFNWINFLLLIFFLARMLFQSYC